MKKIFSKLIFVFCICALSSFAKADQVPVGTKNYQGEFVGSSHYTSVTYPVYSDSNSNSESHQSQGGHAAYDTVEQGLSYLDLLSSEEIVQDDGTSIYVEHYGNPGSAEAGETPGTGIEVIRDSSGNPVVTSDGGEARVVDLANNGGNQDDSNKDPATSVGGGAEEKPAELDCSKTPQPPGCKEEPPVETTDQVDETQQSTQRTNPNDEYGRGGADATMRPSFAPGDPQRSRGAAPWGKPSPWGTGSGSSGSNSSPGHGGGFTDPPRDGGSSGGGGTQKGNPKEGHTDPNPMGDGKSGTAMPSDLQQNKIQKWYIDPLPPQGQKQGQQQKPKLQQQPLQTK